MVLKYFKLIAILAIISIYEINAATLKRSTRNSEPIKVDVGVAIPSGYRGRNQFEVNPDNDDNGNTSGPRVYTGRDEPVYLKVDSPEIFEPEQEGASESESESSENGLSNYASPNYGFGSYRDSSQEETVNNNSGETNEDNSGDSSENGLSTISSPEASPFSVEESTENKRRKRDSDDDDENEAYLEEFRNGALERFNSYRRQVGLPEVELDDKLSDGAQEWAKFALEADTLQNSCDICTEYIEAFSHRRVSSNRKLPVGVNAAEWVMKRWFQKALTNENSGYGILLRREKLEKLGIGIAYFTDAEDNKEMFIVGRFD